MVRMAGNSGITDQLKTAGGATQLSDIPTQTSLPVANGAAGIYTFARPMRFGFINNNSGQKLSVRMNATVVGECTSAIFDFEVPDGDSFIVDVPSGFKVKTLGIFFPTGATVANFAPRIRFFR